MYSIEFRLYIIYGELISIECVGRRMHMRRKSRGFSFYITRARARDAGFNGLSDDVEEQCVIYIVLN